MLQTRRLRFRFSITLSDFSIDVNFSAALWSWGLLSLTEINTRNISGDKGRQVRKDDNLTAICVQIV
jgi:hypothetical protein